MIDHKLRNVVHKLLFVVFLRKTDLVHLLHLVIPKVTHHRCTSFFLLYNLKCLIFSTLQLYKFVSNFYSDIRLTTLLFTMIHK